jgi:hypothetical protein
MSKVRLTGATSGYTEITAPAVAGSNTITLPTGNGSANQLLKNGATAGSLEFASNVVIDSSGSLLVGISTYSGAGVGFEIEGTGSFGPQIRATAKGSDSYPAFQVFRKSRGASIVQNNDYLFQISCQGFDGTSFISAASIRGEVDGTPGANDMPGRLVFSTTADGADFSTERMRITSGGSILCDSTALIGGDTAPLQADGKTRTALALKGGSNGFFAAFYNTSSTLIGSITGAGGATTFYNTSSDYRIKENVVPLTEAISRVNQLQVHRFNFISHPDQTVDGFIAHEAQEVVPECVTGTKDAVDADGNPVMQGIDQSKLVPLLTAALQEALQQIEALTARVTALEAN